MNFSRHIAAAALVLTPPLAAQPAATDHGVQRPAVDHGAPDPNATPITVTGVPGDGITLRQRRVPAQLNAAETAIYARIFRDIDAGRYSAAESALANMSSSGLLYGSARAQLYLTRGTGKASADSLVAWLGANSDLPQAPRIAAMAQARGATDLPPLPLVHEGRSVSFNARMAPVSAKAGDSPRDVAMIGALKPLLVADANAEAESNWRAMQADTSPAVRTEWAERVAWSYYGAGDDASAIRMGSEAAKGAGEWAALGAWTAGLAGFRSGKCDLAATSFDLVGQRNPPGDLAAAAAYWASRADIACMRPQLVTAHLTKAARYTTTFYGLLAQRTLGLDYPFNWTEPDFISADWNYLAKQPGARRAAALVEIGQLGLADRELRYLSTITEGASYEPLLRLSARLNLPATQYWLAHHPPAGLDPPISARFPAPDWVPYRGWRVDQSLVYAHALQESNFITNATSKAGAKGLMQLMPGTAKLVKSSFGTPDTGSDLTDPAFNFELGQSYLEQLRDMSYTQGLLPKVVAAYNAGPGSVQKWNASLRDNGDPLLFIESIPFKETRHYVEVVIRNFWMYQLRAGTPTVSIDAFAAGLWPRFPGMPGPTGVREPQMAAVASVGAAPAPNAQQLNAQQLDALTPADKQ
jgi:soluble lytic murein transglycosylase